MKTLLLDDTNRLYASSSEYEAIRCKMGVAEYKTSTLSTPRQTSDKIVGKIKGHTAKVLREEYPGLKSRLSSLWTRSKFVSSCGDVTLQVTKDYIEGQSGQ